MEKLSKEQAVKIISLSQRIPPSKTSGKAIDSTLEALEHLGYIQIDTISIIARAHHHTLWNRNPRYKNDHLGQLISDKKVFEYWSHAAAYLPMCDFRFSLPRKLAYKNGSTKHWYDVNKRLMKKVLDRITSEGPLMAKDFEYNGEKLGIWESKPAKRALIILFMRGDLMISGRQRFHKVYDLTARVLPEGIDLSVPTNDEYARHLVTSYLRANGLGTIREIIYLLKKTKSLVSAIVQEMVEHGELIEIKIGDNLYFAMPSVFDLLQKRISRNKLKILSPFDNMVIQRKRVKNFFGFDYFLECYLPKSKRRYGYFVLPLLWNVKFVGRMDCKADRVTGIFHIFRLFVELEDSALDIFAESLRLELLKFVVFNACHTVKIHDVIPAKHTKYFQSYLEPISSL